MEQKHRKLLDREYVVQMQPRVLAEPVDGGDSEQIPVDVVIIPVSGTSGSGEIRLDNGFSYMCGGFMP